MAVQIVKYTELNQPVLEEYKYCRYPRTWCEAAVREVISLHKPWSSIVHILTKFSLIVSELPQQLCHLVTKQCSNGFPTFCLIQKLTSVEESSMCPG